MKRYTLITGMVVVYFILSTTSLFADDAIIGPAIRLDPDDAEGSERFALEYAAVARGLDVVAVWMNLPQDFEGVRNPWMQRRAFSSDGGTTWVFENVHTPGTENNSGVPETDPMSAYDPRTGDLWVGAKQGTKGLFLVRRGSGASSFDTGVRAFFNQNGGVDKCWAAAGPKPGFPDTTRLFIASGLPSGFDLLWSDDQGTTWVSPVDLITTGFKLPRVGLTGELYISMFAGNDIKIERSNSLVDPNDPNSAPSFLDSATVVSSQPGHNSAWYPSNFSVVRFAFMAVDPMDSNKIYAVWQDKTSEDNGNTNVDLYFRKATDAMNNDDPPDIGLEAVKIIPAGIEVPGDQFFPWIEASIYQTATGPKTRLHLVFMDSRHNPDQADGDNPNLPQQGFFDVYYAYSDDEGDTWQEYRLTNESFDAGDGVRQAGNRRFFGDYLAMAVAGKRVFPFLCCHSR